MTYVRLMMEVDPIVDISVARELKSLRNVFFDAMRSSEGARIEGAERALVSRYVHYVIEQARLVSSMPNSDDLQPVRELEDELRSSW